MTTAARSGCPLRGVRRRKPPARRGEERRSSVTLMGGLRVLLWQAAVPCHTARSSRARPEPYATRLPAHSKTSSVANPLGASDGKLITWLKVLLRALLSIALRRHLSARSASVDGSVRTWPCKQLPLGYGRWLIGAKRCLMGTILPGHPSKGEASTSDSPKALPGSRTHGASVCGRITHMRHLFATRPAQTRPCGICLLRGDPILCK